MEAANAGSEYDQPRLRNRRARVAWAVAGIVAAAVLAGMFIHWATDVRQSGVRLLTHSKLRSVGIAAQVYQQQHGSAPTLDDLVAAGLMDVDGYDAFSRCESTALPGDPLAFEAWLVQTKPCRAVRTGDAWGGPGEKIDHDLPACRYVLMKDWSVREMQEPDYQRDVAGRVRLTPFP